MIWSNDYMIPFTWLISSIWPDTSQLKRKNQINYNECYSYSWILFSYFNYSFIQGKQTISISTREFIRLDNKNKSMTKYKFHLFISMKYSILYPKQNWNISLLLLSNNFRIEITILTSTDKSSIFKSIFRIYF